MLQRLNLSKAGNRIEQLYANRDGWLLEGVIIGELMKKEKKLSASRVLHGAFNKIYDGVATVLLHWTKAEVAWKIKYLYSSGQYIIF